MEHFMSIIEETLSDGSKVYDVALSDNIVFHAVTENDADDLAMKIQDAIHKHSNDRMIVRYR